MNPGSTIAAIATAPAPAGVGIVRVSGPAALEAVRAVIGELPRPLEPRRAYLSSFRGPDGALLDEGLWLFFPGPNSYTGEDVVELQAHGGVRLLRLLLEAVLADDRVRPARPGEFTERAFLNGRIDLTRAEAIADLVAARSEAAVRSAAAQLKGGLFEAVSSLRRPLLELYADLEAALGFPDEADGAEADAAARLDALAGKAEALLARGRRGRLVRQGARVVLFGPVNAGKSSLFNRLLEEDRALVDADPGTTRDLLEAALELDGQAVTLVDTAGLREPAERVEALGIARAREAVAGADLALLVVPPGCRESEAHAWSELAAGVKFLAVRSKADLVDAGAPGESVFSVGDARTGEARSTCGAAARLGDRSDPGHGVRSALPVSEAAGLRELPCVSALTGAGVTALRSRIVELLFGEDGGEAVLLTSERHREALRRASEAIARARAAIDWSTLEVVAGEVGVAVEALGEISGESAPRDLVDQIFARFCIGK